MKSIIILIVLVSCAQAPVKPREDEVSLGAALNQSQMSYMKGCVDAMAFLKVPVLFENCRDMARDHRRELDSIMNQEIQ
jgi:hypothetical protein